MAWQRRRSQLPAACTNACRMLLLVLAVLIAPASTPAGPHALGPPPKARKPPSAPAPASSVPVDGPTGTPEADTELAARINALVDQLPDTKTRNAARAGILAIGKDATPTLLTRFNDPDFTIRWEMANIQGDLRDDRAVTALVDNVLYDMDPHIRWRSIWALNEFPPATDQRTIGLLKEATTNVNWATRWNAAIGLSMFRVQECLPFLEKGITDENSWRRWEAINALGRIHDERSADFLGPVLLNSTDKRERSEAVLSLGKVGTPKAIDLLISVLEDADQGVRWRACMALGLAGDVRAIKHLERVRDNDSDPDVVRHATKALAAIASRRP